MASRSNKRGIALVEAAIALAVFTIISISLVKSVLFVQAYQRRAQIKEIEEDILASLAQFVVKKAFLPEAVAGLLPYKLLSLKQSSLKFLSGKEVKYELHPLLPQHDLIKDDPHFPTHIGWLSLLSPWQDARGLNRYNEIAISLEIPTAPKREVRFGEFIQRYCFINLGPISLKDCSSIKSTSKLLDKDAPIAKPHYKESITFVED